MFWKIFTINIWFDIIILSNEVLQRKIMSELIDILTTISFLHKQLDECFVVLQHIIMLK